MNKAPAEIGPGGLLVTRGACLSIGCEDGRIGLAAT